MGPSHKALCVTLLLIAIAAALVLWDRPLRQGHSQRLNEAYSGGFVWGASVGPRPPPYQRPPRSPRSPKPPPARSPHPPPARSPHPPPARSPHPPPSRLHPHPPPPPPRPCLFHPPPRPVVGGDSSSDDSASQATSAYSAYIHYLHGAALEVAQKATSSAKALVAQQDKTETRHSLRLAKPYSASGLGGSSDSNPAVMSHFAYKSYVLDVYAMLADHAQAIVNVLDGISGRPVQHAQ